MCSRPRRAASTPSALFVFVAVLAADALVAAGAESPAAVLRRRAVAGEEHATHVARGTGVLKGSVEFVDGAGAEGVAYLGAVEGHAHGAVGLGAVVGDVFEVEARDGLPLFGVENGGYHGFVSSMGRRQ